MNQLKRCEFYNLINTHDNSKYHLKIQKLSMFDMSINCRRILRVMVFNTTFNNISVVWWRFVLTMEETDAPGEK